MIMEPIEMDLNIHRLLKRKSISPNFVSGVFLKNVHFLNTDCSKFAITGIFQHNGFQLGLAIYSKKGCLFWPFDVVGQLAPLTNLISNALNTGCGKHVSKLESGEEMTARKLFGKWYVHMSDTINNVVFSAQEWSQFIAALPLILHSMKSLFFDEVIIRKFIIDSLSSETEVVPPEESAKWIDHLVHEIYHFKHFPVNIAVEDSTSRTLAPSINSTMPSAMNMPSTPSIVDE